MGKDSQLVDNALVARNLVTGYGGDPILNGVDVDIPAGQITALIGPNGCGKSTLLKALGNQLAADSGEVLLNDRPLKNFGSRELARHVSFLPQRPTVPEDITVRELIGFGRYAYTGAFAGMRTKDHHAVESAAQLTRVDELLDIPATELSGGQAQRAWIAMTVAQEAPILLLDEPTTYLDPAHQLSVLHLIKRLNEEGRTVAMVLHDMVQAVRFADNVVAMKDGSIVAAGSSRDMLTAELIGDIFDVECLHVEDPAIGAMLPVPFEIKTNEEV